MPWCDVPEIPGNGCCAHHAWLELEAAHHDHRVHGGLEPSLWPDGRPWGLPRVGRVVVHGARVLRDGTLDGLVVVVEDPPPAKVPWTPARQANVLRGLAESVTGLEAGGGRNNALARVAFTVGGLVGAGHGDRGAALEWLVDLAGAACPDERWKAVRTVRRQFEVGVERPMVDR